MPPTSSQGLNRRSALGVVSVGAALPLVAAPNVALAQGTPAVARGQSEALFIAGKSVTPIPFAEWEAAATGAEASGAPLRIVQGKDKVDKAPANAARYESKRYDFPSGSFRVLTFKKGGPVLHQIGLETEIQVLQGSVMLTPLFGVKSLSATLGASDAISMLGGTLRNPKPTEDTVLLLAQVAANKAGAKGSIVYGKDVVSAETVQWVADGKEMSARTPEEAKAAPANAARYVAKRYVFDGNSLRYVTLRKGDKTNTAVTSRTDVIIYVPKGRMRRIEGDQTFDMVAGDAVREKVGNPGHWEMLEDSVFIATDAPLLPATFAPTMAAAGGMLK